MCDMLAKVSQQYLLNLLNFRRSVSRSMIQSQFFSSVVCVCSRRCTLGHDFDSRPYKISHLTVPPKYSAIWHWRSYVDWSRVVNTCARRLFALWDRRGRRFVHSGAVRSSIWTMSSVWVIWISLVLFISIVRQIGGEGALMLRNSISATLMT